jgi:hypothetical protein
MTRIASEDPEQARKDAALRGLLNSYERAVLDRFECRGIPDSWDDEEQADIDAAKAEAENRWLRLRTRVFKAAAAGSVEGITLTPEAITAMCDEARRDEINRAADWLLGQAARCFDRGSCDDHHEAQVLTRYSSLLRDMSPFPYYPRETSATFSIRDQQA